MASSSYPGLIISSIGRGGCEVGSHQHRASIILLISSGAAKITEALSPIIPAGMIAGAPFSDEGGSLWQRLTSERGLTAISHYFVMDWAAVWLDIVGGLLIAGALAAWVPDEFWRSFFIVDHPLLATLWGPIVGPLVAVISFVCSVGNIPLAAVLWNGGISFGGVIAFIFADLIVLPILNIYRKYYGWKMAAFLFATFYAAMAAAAL